MNHIRRLHPIRRSASLLAIVAIVAGALLASATMIPTAFALPAPPLGGGGAVPLPPSRTVVVGGMPGWQIALIAAGAAFAAAAMAVILDRARATRRRQAAPSA